MIKVKKKGGGGSSDGYRYLHADGTILSIVGVEGAVLAAVRKSINNCTRLGGTLVVINGLYRYVDW